MRYRCVSLAEYLSSVVLEKIKTDRQTDTGKDRQKDRQKETENDTETER